jgi:hypothetical protein
MTFVVGRLQPYYTSPFTSLNLKFSLFSESESPGTVALSKH